MCWTFIPESISRNPLKKLFLSPLSWQAVIIYKGWMFRLLFRERSWLLFWCLKALLHDRWQIDYKLFEIYASTNTFWYGNEKRKAFGNCGFTVKVLGPANSWDGRLAELLILVLQHMLRYFDVHYIVKWRKIMFLSFLSFFFFFKGCMRGACVFFFSWGKWTYVHTDT